MRGFLFFQDEVFEVETGFEVSKPVFNLHPAFVAGPFNCTIWILVLLYISERS